MILIKELFVVQEWTGNVIWKESLFTKQEAGIEKVIAEKETCKKYEIQSLDDYFTDLTFHNYKTRNY